VKSELSGETAAVELTGVVSAPARPTGRYLFVLSLGALGVVFGDIGTSPLYASQGVLQRGAPPAGHPGKRRGNPLPRLLGPRPRDSVKYLGLVLRAESRGEGGIMVLTCLIRPPAEGKGAKRRASLIILGLFGACLLYGDSVITPAITVLSAVEGVEVATARLKRYVRPGLGRHPIGMFLLQKRGTGKVGAIFGPVMLVWFGALAAAGTGLDLREPAVLKAGESGLGVPVLREDGFRGFLLLGSVVLAVTGGEALYADMGHFGARPIRVTWFGRGPAVARPELLRAGRPPPRAAGSGRQPALQDVPGLEPLPLVILATMASVIASQAVISGAFSLTGRRSSSGSSPDADRAHVGPARSGRSTSPASTGSSWPPASGWSSSSAPRAASPRPTASR